MLLTSARFGSLHLLHICQEVWFLYLINLHSCGVGICRQVGSLKVKCPESKKQAVLGCGHLVSSIPIRRFFLRGMAEEQVNGRLDVAYQICFCGPRNGARIIRLFTSIKHGPAHSQKLLLASPTLLKGSWCRVSPHKMSGKQL